MRLIFTQCSDISDGVILTFDLKTRQIRISSHRRTDGYAENLLQGFDQLFDPACRSRLCEMAVSDMVFQHDMFDALVGRILELADEDKFDMGGAPEIAIEVALVHYDEAVGPHRTERTLAADELLDVLSGQMYRAAYLGLYKKYLQRDLQIDM